MLEKFYQAKKTYERLIESFEDFGCKNYRDTIRKGMPQFFQNYNIYFEPQNHLLMLDYPYLVQSNNLKGVDLILEYLQNIEKENQFLLQFDLNIVIVLMERVIIDYQELYLDNICSLVLLTALGVMIADKPVYSLQLISEDKKLIADFFDGDNCDKIEEKLKALIHILSDKLSCKKLEKYLTSTCRDFAVRIYNAQRNQTICVLFGIQGILEADDIGIDEIILRNED